MLTIIIFQVKVLWHSLAVPLIFGDCWPFCFTNGVCKGLDTRSVTEPTRQMKGSVTMTISHLKTAASDDEQADDVWLLGEDGQVKGALL